MEGRGRSRRRSLHREWKKRLSSVLAVVLTAVMILNMPLSIDGLRMHISDVFASGDNAGRNSVWATASNAHKEHGDSQDVDIYVIADEEAVPGNRSSMTLYLKNNTDQAISEGVLEFSGKYIEKEDASFTDIGSGEEVSQVIIAGPGQETEASGEGMLYQESGNETGSVIGQDIASAENDDALTQTDADDEMDGIEDEADAAEDAGETDEEEPWKLTSIDLQPGELHEVYFEFYTDDDVESTKANVTFKFHGENEDGKRIAGESKFYYSIGLPHVNISLEDGMQIESGVPNDMEIWMSEPDWVDEDLEDRIEEQEEEEAEKEMEEDTESEDTASDSQADKASDSDASRADNASDSNADKNTGNEDGISQEDAEKIHKYTEEAMEISESKVSYTVTVFGMQLSDFQARKTQEAEDIGWISCIYEAARDTQPGIYYGKVTAVGKWNKRAFTSEQGFLFEVTGEGKTGQEFTEELSNMTVHAYAEEGILPDGVQMKVTELSQDKQDTAEQYKKAVQALNDHEVSYDGMLAVDISFINEEGEEIEPDGEVQVSIQMKKDALPEDVDLGTVEVHHLKELDAETVIPEAVADGADKTDGTVQSAEDAVVALEEEGVPEEEIKAAVDEDAAAVAMFSVDGFSTFTITWGRNNWSNYFKITVKYVDENGREIDTSVQVEDKTISSSFPNNQINLDEYEVEIEDYEYVKTTYNGLEITRIKAIEESRSGIFGSWMQKSIVFYNEDEEIGRLSQKWRDEANISGEILLVYKSTVETPPEVTDDRKLTHYKYATLNDDGTYDLSLTVSGAVGTETNKVKMDVLLIVDRSGSMKYKMTANSDASEGNRRIDKVADATKLLTSTLSNNKNLDVRYSVVTFSGPDDWNKSGSSNDASTLLDWTSTATQVNSSIARINPNGGTNYQAGINQGIEQLKSVRPGTQTIVIFLTDGLPTVRNDARPCDENDSDEVGFNNNAAVNAIRAMSVNSFYCIGAGPGFSANNSSARNNLIALSNAATANDKEVYSVSNTDELNNAFKNIVADSTTILCDNVAVSDSLIENVKVVMNGNSPKKLVVTIEQVNDDEKVVIGGESDSITLPKTEQNDSATITASYTDGKIALNFPSRYKLEPNWNYIVTVTIDATETAYQKYRNQQYQYEDLADLGTGDHEGTLGFYSNDKAEVTYCYKNTTETEAYDKPVIQIHPGTLTITKDIVGLEELSTDELEALEEKMEFEVTLSWHGNSGEEITDSETYPLSQFNKDSDSGLYTLEIKGLSPNTSYTVTEVPGSADVSGYVVDTEWNADSDKGTIPKGGALTASVTNTYTRNIQPPTGLTTNNYPYWLMLAIAAVGATSFIYPTCRRRRHKGDR